MALIKKGIGKKEIIRLLLIVGGFIVVGVIFLSIISEGPDIDLNSNTNQSIQSRVIKDTGLDLLENETFSELKKHGKLPVEKGNYGKLNPFTKI